MNSARLEQFASSERYEMGVKPDAMYTCSNHVYGLNEEAEYKRGGAWAEACGKFEWKKAGRL